MHTADEADSNFRALLRAVASALARKLQENWHEFCRATRAKPAVNFCLEERLT